MDGNLREGASSKAGAGDPMLGKGNARFMSQTPLPLGHLSAMFGLSIMLAAMLLVGGMAFNFRTAEIETQAPQLAEYRVDINSDRWVEFANLPSVGKKTAQSIVEYGQAIGGYRTVDQLLEVKGVGQKTLATVRPYIIPVQPNITVEQAELPNP